MWVKQGGRKVEEGRRLRHRSFWKKEKRMQECGREMEKAAQEVHGRVFSM
jgi:hypothetical protein